MGKASITIAVSSVFNGSGIAAASKSMDALGGKLARMERLASQGANSMSRDMAMYAQSVSEAGRRTEEAGRRMASMGDALTKGVTAPLLAAGGYAGKMAVDFDTALANVRKTSDLTEAQLEDLAKSALEMSKTQPVSAETILNVEALGAQLGISNDRLEDFAKTVSGLDIATNMDAETAATEMARFANIVGMTEDKFSNYGSTLVAIGNNMATTESEVSQMAQRFASAGAQAGLSEAQILGMSGAMSSLGIKAEMGGSALSQVFVSIGNAVSSGGAELEAFAKRAGMSAGQFRAAWETDAAGAFNSLIEGIGAATAAGEDMNAIMAELGFTQIRQSDVMRRLAGSTEAVTGKQSVLAGALALSTQAWEQNTALQSEVDKKNESMAARLEVFKNKIDAIAITVGRPLVDALIAFLDAIDPVVQGVAGAAQAFADMDEASQRNVVAMAGLAAAAGPVLSVTGRVTQAVGRGMQAWGDYTGRVAVVSDAMSNLDGASLRTYASTKSLASQLGVSGNKAVKAAGGVENYVRAWDGMHEAAGRVKKLSAQLDDLPSKTFKSEEAARAYERSLVGQKNAAERAYVSQAKLVSAFGDSTEEARKAASGIKALEPALGKVEAGFKDSDKVLASYNKGLRATEATTKAVGVSMGTNLASGAKLAAAGMLNFAKACAPVLALTAVVSIIGAIADQLARAEQEQRLMADATRSASDIMAEAGAAYGRVGDAIGAIKPDVEGTLEAMRSLNEEASSTLTELAVNSGTIDSYVSTMAELMNQSGLTAVEQEKLRIAVEGYNSITGEALSLTDAANGKISDQNGNLVENAEQIRQSAAAWRERAEAEAYAQLATEYLKQQIEAEHELSVAKANVTELEKQANAALEESERLYSSGDYLGGAEAGRRHIELSRNLKENRDGLEKLEQAAKSAGENYEAFTVQAAINSSGLAQEVKDDISAQETCYQEFALAVATHLQSSGQSIGTFEQNLASMGASTDAMRKIGEENFAALWAECDGDVSLMVQKINEYNGTPLDDKDANLDAHGKVAEGYAKEIVEQTTRKINELPGKTVYVNANGNYDWARTSIAGLGSAIGGLASKTVDIIANVTQRHAAGGITPGRVALHARGGIATRATDVTHIIGEAGAEALIPLENRRRVRPFARVVAEEMRMAAPGGHGAQPAGNTYVLNINGARIGSASPRLVEAMALVFDEMDRMNLMGVG